MACELAAFGERATKRGMTIREFRIQTHAVHEPHPIRHILDLDISSRSEVSFHAVFECDARVFDTHCVQCIDFTTWCWQADGRFIGDTDAISAIEEGALLRVRPTAMTVAVDDLLTGPAPRVTSADTGARPQRAAGAIGVAVACLTR